MYFNMVIPLLSTNLLAFQCSSKMTSVNKSVFGEQKLKIYIEYICHYVVYKKLFYDEQLFYDKCKSYIYFYSEFYTVCSI